MELASWLGAARSVAIGGSGLNRKPMGLVRALADSGVSGLTLISFLGSVDVEYLLASGRIDTLHTSGTGLDALGLAPGYRRARQSGSPVVIEWSEGSLAAALEAGSRGLDSMPCATSPDSDVVRVNPYLEVHPDPFTGTPTTFARSLTPHLGLIQGSAVDAEGNIFIDGDPAIEAMVARACRVTIASVLDRQDRPAREAAISRIWIDDVEVDRDGAWPTGCLPGPGPDIGAISAWVGSGADDLSILRQGS